MGPFTLRPVFVTGAFVIDPAAPIDVVIAEAGPTLARITLPSATVARIGRIYAIRALGPTLVVAVAGDSVLGVMQLSPGSAEMLMSDGGKRWISIADRGPAVTNPLTGLVSPGGIRDALTGGAPIP
jgi:hypothetical protein